MTGAARELDWTPPYLGDRIATLRRRRGMTQKQLAAAVRSYGIALDHSIMARFEKWGSDDRNARKPSFAHLWVIAHILRVDVRRDLGATEEEYPELALIRRGLATPSLLAGKGNGGTVGRGFFLTYRGRRKPDTTATQPTLESSLIHSVPAKRHSRTAGSSARARPA